jgi:hypothetical protein
MVLSALQRRFPFLGESNLLEKPHLLPTKMFLPLPKENHSWEMHLFPTGKLTQLPKGKTLHPNALEFPKEEPIHLGLVDPSKWEACVSAPWDFQCLLEVFVFPKINPSRLIHLDLWFLGNKVDFWICGKNKKNNLIIVIMSFPTHTSSVTTPLWPSVGVKPNTWKSWRFGALRDSRMFRAQQQGPKHLALRCSWCHSKCLET